MTNIRSSRATSRRRFLKVAALGATAAVAAAALPGGVDAAKTAASALVKPKPSGRPPAIEAEVAKQKQSTADLLKTIREFELPPGSEMAFAFVPSKAPKRKPAARAATMNGGSR